MKIKVFLEATWSGLVSGGLAICGRVRLWESGPRRLSPVRHSTGPAKRNSSPHKVLYILDPFET